MTHAPQGSPEQVRASVNEAYAVLKGVKTIDIFEMARVDPKVPIETSITALKELVDEGLIGAVGLSEVSAATIRRAAKIAKIAAVEIELSLFTPDGLNNGVVQTCHERELKFRTVLSNVSPQRIPNANSGTNLFDINAPYLMSIQLGFP